MRQSKSSVNALLRQAVLDRNIPFLCLYHFRTRPTGGQQEIIREIAFREHDRVVISAYTQYGKTWAVAQGVLLYLWLNYDQAVRLIAPLIEQASILRNYIAEFLLESKEMRAMLELDVWKLERMKTEVSKSRITFKNNREMKILSAEGDAKRLLGWGGNLIICDESCNIDGDVYNVKITRMLGGHKESVLVDIGNPWHRNNHFYQHWCDPNFLKIRIDYRQGIAEGRITEEFVEEQRRTLTPMMFKVLYEADFPEEAEDQLIRKEWVDRALYEPEATQYSDEKVGLDVAEHGLDSTVLTVGYWDKGILKVRKIFSWEKRDTMETVGWTVDRIRKDGDQCVDSIGVGSGVYARLKELGYNATAFKSSESPDEDYEGANRFLNRKAQAFWRLRDLFEQGLIKIPKHPQLIKELLAMRYTVTSTGKVKIIDPKKSPDFADSCRLLSTLKDSEFEIISR